jgi:class 3 adenylate cyclase/tetratricopeptide (TPR) repeat protein
MPSPAGQKFCGECGAALQSASGDAARFSSPGSYTPKHLIEKILTARLSLEGERKQVTVLFADIKGSLELLVGKDPEDVRKLLDPVLEQLMQAVHRYEGTVNQVLGDGVMAIFGAPVAHEDHAIRACYAALRMQKSIEHYADQVRRSDGISLQVRIGINSGEVVVRSIGSDLQMDYTAIGQTTHLAARMEQIARPGTVLITGDTLRLAEGYVDVNAVGPVSVKGLANTVDAFEVTGAGPVRSRFQAAAARGLTPFVGRRSEMDELRGALSRARHGEPQVVAVVGEPGVGKSRLVHEFVHSRQTSGWLVVESNSASYGQATPYLPVIELLKNYFKVDLRDNARTIQEKVTGKLFTLDPALQAFIPPLLHLLDSLPEEHAFRSLDPVQHRQATYAAISQILLAENRLQPVIAVFEDLHWNDSLTLGLLNALVTATTDARLLLLVSYRPEHQDDWKDRANYRRLKLEPLGQESVAELLEGLLGPDASLSPLKSFLLDRSGGNPFFVEEIVRTLIETGVITGARRGYRVAKPYSSIHVPPTVQAVIASRIDRLPGPEKRVLQEAAVIGNDAPYTLLQEICGLPEDQLRALLANLESAEFLYVTRLFPDLEYTFKHSLTHEVAYSGLLHERRREIHARIVSAIERLYAGRLNEQVERLAHHAFRAQLHDKALGYLRQAGAKAAERHAYREAAALFEQALGVLPGGESRELLEQAIDLRFEIRNALQPLGERERIADYLRQAEPLALRLGDPRRIGWIQSYLTEYFWMLGRPADAIAAGERAVDAARRLSDLALEVVTNLPLGLVHHTRGDYRRAIECFQWNVEHLQGDLVRERFGMFVLPSLFSRSFVAWSLAELGDFARAVEIGDEAVHLAENAHHPFSAGYAHLGMGVLYLRRGDLRRSIFSFERALSVGAFSDSPVGFSFVAFHLGYALALAGRVPEGIALLEKTVAVAEAKRFVARHSLRLAYLAESYLLAGRRGDAQATADRSLELARQHDERGNEAYALRVRATVGALEGRAAEAEPAFRQALNLAETLGMRPLAAHCHLGLAQLLDSSAHLETAHQELESMRMRRWGENLASAFART